MFSPHCLSGGQQNDSSRGIIPSEKPLQQAELLNSQHKIKKLRLDDTLSGGLVIFPIRKHTQHTTEAHVFDWKVKVNMCCSAWSPNVSGITHVADEHAVKIGFHQWLASVTERIHLTMHYQNNGTTQFSSIWNHCLFSRDCVMLKPPHGWFSSEPS